METRYQVFVSSTYRDLIEERQAALEAVIELRHFPAAMEAFPAASERPWELIQRIIAESDYYILIIGGKYGSIEPQSGLSYTELEYDFASSHGIPTLAFLYQDLGKLPGEKLELQAEPRQKLENFRKKAEERTCKYWTSHESLKSKIMVALVHQMRLTPRVGWIRADERDSPETLRKMNLLLEENAALTTEINGLKQSGPHPSEMRFAHEDEVIRIRYTHGDREKERDMPWSLIFLGLAPLMITKKDEAVLARTLYSGLLDPTPPPKIDLWSVFKSSNSVSKDDWDKVALQFLALDYWEATECERDFTNINTYPPSITKRPVRGFKLSALGLKRYAEKKAAIRGHVPNTGS